MNDKWIERWGWTLPVFLWLLAALNIWMIASFDGGPLNWGSAAICFLSGVWTALTWLAVRL